MHDRQPKYPGRIKLRDVETGEERIYDMTMADEPNVTGDAPVTENLLKQQTAALFGLGPDAVPDEVLSAIRGPGAITKTHLVASDNTVLAGDVVDIVDDQIIVTIEATAAETKNFANGNTAVVKMLSNDLAITGYVDNSYIVYVALINTRTGEKIGTQKQVTAYGNFNSPELIVLSENKIALIANSPSNSVSQLYIISIEGTAITVGSPLSLTVGNQAYNRCVALSSTRIAVFGYSTSQYGIRVDLYDITETTAQKVSGVEDVSFSASLSNACITLISGYGGSAQKLFCAYIDKTTTFVAGVIVTISGTSVSFGAQQIFISEGSFNFSTASAHYLQNGYIVFAPSKSGKVYLFSLYVSGSTIFTRANSVEFGVPGSTVNGFVSIGSNEVAVLSSQGANVALTTMKVEDQISWTELVSLYTLMYNPSFDMLANGEFIVVLRNGSTLLDSSIVQRRGSAFGGSFVNTSTQAIALQPGNPGDAVEVIFAGTIFADWVVQGQQITSTGVKGAGILPGVLQVYGADSPGTKIVTGSYVGTGQYGQSSPNTLKFESPPKIVWILGNQSGYLQYAQVFSNFPSMIFTPDANTSLWVLLFSQNFMTWYSSGNAGNQFNISGFIYHYVAIL